MADDRDTLLERLFDGDLPEDAASALRGESPEAIELQRRIDAELREAFAPGRPREAIPMRRRAGAQDISWRRLAAYAAAVLILAGAGFWVRHTIERRRSFNPMESPERIYTRLVQRGFAPEFVCEPGPEFVRAVRDRFGAALDIEPAEGVRIIGWAYDSQRPIEGPYAQAILSENMLILMAYVDDKPAIVLMDRAEADDRPRLAPGSDLRQFRRRLGDFVLYEVTPLGRKRLLPDFLEKP